MPSLAAQRRLAALAAGLRSAGAAATTPTPAQTEAMRSTAMDFAPLPASIPAMAQQLVDDGFLHFPAALNPDQAAELKALLDWAQENPNPDPEAKDRHPCGPPHPTPPHPTSPSHPPLCLCGPRGPGRPASPHPPRGSSQGETQSSFPLLIPRPRAGARATTCRWCTSRTSGTGAQISCSSPTTSPSAP